VDALPHLNLRHYQRRLARMIDTDESIRRELADDIIRRLYRFVARAHGNMRAETLPPIRTSMRTTRHAFPDLLNADHKKLL
jgi:hypothetical protein